MTKMWSKKKIVLKNIYNLKEGYVLKLVWQKSFLSWEGRGLAKDKIVL